MKIDITKNKQKIEDKKYYTEKCNIGQAPPLLSQEEKIKYENVIQKLEEKERFLTKLNFSSQFQKEPLENKIEI